MSVTLYPTRDDVLFTEGNIASQADVLAAMENLNQTGQLPVSDTPRTFTLSYWRVSPPEHLLCHTGECHPQNIYSVILESVTPRTFTLSYWRVTPPEHLLCLTGE